DAAPALIWLSERLLERTTWRRALALAAAGAVAFTMGSFAYLVPLLGFGLAWGVGLWWCSPQLRNGRRLAGFALGYGAATAWAAVLGAAALLPFLELLRLADRGGEYVSEPLVLLLGGLVGAPGPARWLPSLTGALDVGLV